ncbi:hypothetical protein [Actinospica robiniae]|uniref:Uncharacterized protein n=1 Tax=Actinospica robiniae DSM 44927 TaxID=479430 RepID=W9DZ97_9ACTN|nr:hypothetical protein [Actinospica robiniae]ETA71138.1 hypothetical protein ActroDRAFT_0164 [Actinospica robiniae DSM 44927]
MTRTGKDAASRILGVAVALFPPDRRDWGQAMRAELAALEDPAARRRFALGCLRVALTRPSTLRTLGYPALMLGALAAAVWWSGRIGYGPLRWAVLAAAAALLAFVWWGRRPGALGPVGPGRVPRLARACGCMLVCALVLAGAASVASNSNPGEQAAVGVPIYTAVSAGYLFAFLAVTSRATAHRGAVPARTLAVGGGVGGAAAAIWVAVLATARPMPTATAPLIALIAGAVIVAAVVAPTSRRASGRPLTGRAKDGLIAGLCAGASAALLAVESLTALATYGPAAMIPDLAPVALTRADDLAQSRSEIQDPYVAILLLGGLLAIALCLSAIRVRRPSP